MATGSAPQPERRENTTRESLFAMVAEIRQDVGEIKTALFGPAEQKELGFVHRTNERLESHSNRIGSLEKRIWGWAGAVTILTLAGTLLVNWLLRHTG